MLLLLLATLLLLSLELLLLPLLLLLTWSSPRPRSSSGSAPNAASRLSSFLAATCGSSSSSSGGQHIINTKVNIHWHGADKGTIESTAHHQADREMKTTAATPCDDTATATCHAAQNSMFQLLLC
jgi:hypothetical protein